MKKLIQAAALFFFFSFFTSASGKIHHSIQSSAAFVVPRKILVEPRATFDKIWVDYDVTEEGYKGMRIHVKFTAYDMLNMDAYVAIYFLYNNGTDTYLKDKNSRYNSSDGDVAVYKSIKPQYNPAYFDDLQLFMPYSELDLGQGKYSLTMDVKVIYKQGGLISKLTKHNFDYTKGPGSLASSNFKKMWVDYDVYESGKKGMRIHVNFEVDKMKNQQCYLIITFEKKNGSNYDIMESKSYDEDYSNIYGDLIIYKKLNPCCDNTNYADLQLFMPYDEFNLSSSVKNNLRMDLDVSKSIDDTDMDSSDFIGHLNFYTFWYGSN